MGKWSKRSLHEITEKAANLLRCVAGDPTEACLQCSLSPA